jgi:hypothetical protein
MMRRLIAIPVLSFVFLVLGPGLAFACGGLVADEHAEVLRKATTLAAWHEGYEHYVTGFQFAGTANSFGYIIPLPAAPTKIEKGGDWTLERLELEVSPQRRAFDAALAKAPSPVEVLQQVRIDALDIVVVRGGGPDVAAWAERNGFDLTPDSPKVLGRYSSAGAIFALARFDRDEATERGLIEGQGTTIHFTIPTPAPWIPLQILALGKGGSEVVEADLFVLTDHVPSLTPGVWGMPGMSLRSFGRASESLLDDLRSDRGMEWVPRGGMWLTALSLRTPAADLRHDLSIDGGGPIGRSTSSPARSSSELWLSILVGGAAAVAVLVMWRPAPPPVGHA